MKLMYFFESSTNSKLNDCFIDENKLLTFVVSEKMGLAVGKNGETAKKLESQLKRKI